MKLIFYLFMGEGWSWFDFESWGTKFLQIIVYEDYIKCYPIVRGPN